ncbi:progranulin-like isoform 1-T2 [Aulostomus maculatus]
MLKLAVWLLLGGFVSCNIKCPDGTVCPGVSTCCRTEQEYSCCPYPNAVCCPDLANCCPPGFHCNLAAQQCERKDQPWMSTPLLKKMAAQEPKSPPPPPVPQPKELTETPMVALRGAGAGVIRCDSEFFCSQGSSCCRAPTGRWNCCPYPLGQCCADGLHCCEYGHACNPSSMSCNGRYTQNPSGPQGYAQTD